MKAMFYHLRCPNCGNEEDFVIDAIVTVRVSNVEDKDSAIPEMNECDAPSWSDDCWVMCDEDECDYEGHIKNMEDAYNEAHK